MTETTHRRESSHSYRWERNAMTTWDRSTYDWATEPIEGWPQLSGLITQPTLGRIIRSQREERGLGTRAAAKEMGIATMNLSRLERGCEPLYSTAARAIAWVLIASWEWENDLGAALRRLEQMVGG